MFMCVSEVMEVGNEQHRVCTGFKVNNEQRKTQGNTHGESRIHSQVGLTSVTGSAAQVKQLGETVGMRMNRSLV